MLKCILQASAGTGKTHQIVSLGLEPAGGSGDFSCLKDTVFLSFSNAAAEEIKARLYKETAPKEVSTFGEAIGGSEARVYTVHSFCFELARIFRYELGLPADARFPTDENSSVWENCVSDFFRSHWDLGSLALTLNLKEGDPAYDLLKVLYLLGDRKSLRDFIIKHGQKVFFLGEVLDPAGAAAAAAAVPGDIEDLARELILARLANKSREPEKLAAALEKAVPLLRATRPVLENIISHIGKHTYIPYMYSRGIFDFDSLVFLVVKLLRDMKAQKEEGMSAFLRRLEDEGFGFKRLFIDEAQDCDILMNALIGYFLADKCVVKTTLVGDAKQSVYRWRNAFPEEFLKMCEEAEKQGKRTSLLDSYRIKNPNTLDFINGLIEKVAEDYNFLLAGDEGEAETVSFFDYKAKDDRLSRPPDAPGKNWMPSTAPLEVEYGIISKRNDIYADKDAVKDFINRTPGRTGVIFRSRSAFRNSKLSLMLKDELQYRMSEPFEQVDEDRKSDSEFTEDEIGDIDPDYYLLKTLTWCFASADRHKAAAALLLSRKGLELAKGLWPRHINDAAVSSPEAFVKAAAAVYGEIQSLYYGAGETSTAEKIYSLLKGPGSGEDDGAAPGLWPVFFRRESLLSPENTARSLNHALAGLYLHEISGVRDEGGDDVLKSLGASKIPYESCLSYDVDMDKLGFAEAVTIHSSKGLTYDKVILILDSNKTLKAAPDGKESPEEFAHLFHAEFRKVAGPKQEIEIDYFPYLGGLPAASMENGRRYPGLGRLYNSTYKRVKAEKANLFYVALTRTKKHLMILDNGTPPGFLTASGAKSKSEPPRLLGMIKGLCKPGQISMKLLKTGPWIGGRPELRSLSEREGLELPGAFRLVGVRTDIKDLGELTAAPQISAGAARLVGGGSMNMYVGVRVHQIIAELMLRAPGPDAYDAVVRNSPAVSLDEAGRLAADILLRPENKALLQPLFSYGAKNLPELRVWGKSADGKRLLNGIVDGVLVDQSKVTVLEYKTIFGSSEGQTALGEKQKERYILLLGRLKGARAIEGAVIGIKAG
ncbi:MAG: ATP-dependent helicase/nuclease subunit A [Elusimicrobia bacterium]|nr:MAG: ATP-dependent helicase/nuclease subunit A [Elusimicrobiota bacterium]KAF0155711.1 MAG: ATP-dependent helicase/nuclease subunit A [Elusimicrobiota bacterium]